MTKVSERYFFWTGENKADTTAAAFGDCSPWQKSRVDTHIGSAIPWLSRCCGQTCRWVAFLFALGAGAPRAARGTKSVAGHAILSFMQRQRVRQGYSGKRISLIN